MARVLNRAGYRCTPDVMLALAVVLGQAVRRTGFSIDVVSRILAVAATDERGTDDPVDAAPVA